MLEIDVFFEAKLISDDSVFTSSNNFLAIFNFSSLDGESYSFDLLLNFAIIYIAIEAGLIGITYLLSYAMQFIIMFLAAVSSQQLNDSVRVTTALSSSAEQTAHDAERVLQVMETEHKLKLVNVCLLKISQIYLLIKLLSMNQ